MVAMAVSARIHMTIDGRIIRVNVVASTLVAYLVLTSLITVRDASARQRAIDAGAAGAGVGDSVPLAVADAARAPRLRQHRRTDRVEKPWKGCTFTTVNTRRPPVLVLGSDLTVLGTMRLLAEAGFEPLVVGAQSGMVERSRWYRAAPHSGSAMRPEEDLEAWLEGLPLERAVVLPCSDHWVLRAARCSVAMRERFPMCLSSLPALELLIDKWTLAQVLNELALPQPRTLTVDSAEAVAALPDAALDGMFIKPRDSARFFRQFGVKAFHVRSRTELMARLREVEQHGLAVQLQEYIPGPASSHFYVEGFIDRAGAVRTIFTRQRLRMYPLDFGNSTHFQSVHPSEIPDAVVSVQRLLAHVGFRGIFSAEFKRDARDGICRLIEVNARPWWYVEFAGQCGANVCAMYVADALGEPVAPVTGFTVGMRCVYPYYDYFACRALRESNSLTLLEWTRSWLTSTQPVLRWSDPAPSTVAARILLNRAAAAFGLAPKRSRA